MAKQKTTRLKKKASQPEPLKSERQQYGPLHPWRVCPIGQHWVRTHDVHCEPGPQHPEGTYVRHGHCHTNPSHKDHLYQQETEQIAKDFFPTLAGPPALNNLKFVKHGNEFDQLIRGWTKYWNEIFQPEEPLDPNLVKALIATESGFNANADNGSKGDARARGLMQVTDGTRKALRDKSGRLDHLITLTDKDAYNPNLNIAAGIRWLFEKRRLASHKLKREADWMEAILEYKGMRRKPRTTQEKINFPRIRAKLKEYYESLKKTVGP